MKRMIRTPRLTAIVTLLVLCALAPAASAQETATEPAFALNLAASIEDGDLAAPELEAAPARQREVHLAALDAFTDPNAWRAASASEAALQQEQSQQKSGGFGRWMKKRWYVPVIAAVVVGVTVADDDDSGEEDGD